MISSCLGKSLREVASELWQAMVLSAQSSNSVQAAKRRREWNESAEYEMDFRGRSRMGY